MKNLTLTRLSILVLVIGSAYFLLLFNGSNQSSNNFALSKKIEWQNINKITLEKEGKVIEIANEADKWFLPAKFNFPASTSHIRAFLLKLMDFSNAQKINISTEGLDKLGLTEEGKKVGHGIITLSYKDQQEQVKIFLGSLRSRKGETMANELNLTGQYLKYSSSEQVFMLPIAINLEMEEKKWIDTDLISIQPSEIYSIESASIEKVKDVKNLDYFLTKSGNILSSEPKFDLSLNTPEGKVLQSSSITQVSSALEGLTFVDVVKKEDETIKKAEFAKSLKFNLLSGKVYQIKIDKIDNKNFIKVSVEFDPLLVSKLDQIKKDTEKNNENTPKKEADNLNDKNSNLKIEYANAEEVVVENKKFEDWVYEVPDFVYSRFTKKADDFFGPQNSIEPKK
jgi:hypothetical protein